MSTDGARRRPSLAADPLPPIDLVLKAEVLKAEAETIGEGKERSANDESAKSSRSAHEDARRARRFLPDRGATRDSERSVVPRRRRRAGSRRRASVSVNDLASDPAKARETKPKLPKPAEEKKKKKRRASLPASTPATPARGGAKKNAKAQKRKSEPSAKLAEPEKAPASYAVSEPDPGPPRARARCLRERAPAPAPAPGGAGAGGAGARRAAARQGAAGRGVHIARRVRAVKRECLRRILWG